MRQMSHEQRALNKERPTGTDDNKTESRQRNTARLQQRDKTQDGDATAAWLGQCTHTALWPVQMRSHTVTVTIL